MSDFECPYCGEEQEVCNDDGAGYDESNCEVMQCTSCDKFISFSTYIPRPTYTPHKVDCLNELAPHQWTAKHTYPKEKELAKMQCKICDEERQMTEEEFKIWVS